MRVETIGDATLYLGDCLEILPTLPKVDAVVTSPPYNQLGSLETKKLSGIWALKGRGGKRNGQFVDNGYADEIDERAYQTQQAIVFGKCFEICADGASLFYNHQLRWRDGECLHPVRWFNPDGWKLRSEIVWNRGGGMMFNARMFCRFDERVLWFCKGRHKWNQDAVGYGTVWQIARQQHKDHPVAFPVEIPRRCIAATTDVGDVVLDPYMGSATTGVACANLGRRFIGIEIEPKYFDIACERIDNAYRQQRMFA